MSLALSQYGASPDRPVVAVRELARDRIRHRYRKFRNVAKESSSESEPEELHEVRIRGKRLRFTLELFKELYGPPAEKLIEEVVDVQDRLGEHQDLCVLNERLTTLLRAYGSELSTEALVLTGVLLERNNAHAEAIRASWKRGPRDVYRRWRRLRDELDVREVVPAAEDAPTV
jgi:CHAD domain-containing protein